MLRILFVLHIVLSSLSYGRAQTKQYVFATYTYATNNRLQNLEPLASFLSQKTGFNFKAISYPTVQALISAIRDDSVDFAMMNTSGYLVLQHKYPGIVSPLVNLDMGTGSFTGYCGCLIAGNQTKVRSIKDLKKKEKLYSLALVNSSSTSGNLVPRLLLNDKKIPDADAFFTVSYSGTHQKVVEDVLKGSVAIGGCGCAEVDSSRKYQAFDSKAVVLDSFSNIPLGPVVYNKKLDAQIVKTVSGYLLNLHQSNPGLFENFCNGWTEFKGAVRFKTIADKDYNSFRKMFGNNTRLWKLIE